MTDSPWLLPLDTTTAEEHEAHSLTRETFVTMRELTRAVENYTPRNSGRINFLFLHLCYIARVYKDPKTSESDLKSVLQLMFDEAFGVSKELKEWSDEVMEEAKRTPQ